jgi:histidyl-tRNA synthetase
VWFPAADEQAKDSVKDIRSGDQVDADPDTWSPPAEDLRPSVTPAGNPQASHEEQHQ